MKVVESITSRLAWFLQNLGMLLHDLALEKKGFEVRTYFDTHDVRDIILGLQAFYRNDGSIDIKEFGSKRTLVQCLAASGMLGRISMLPPHNAEFLQLLDHSFYLGVEAEPMRRVEQFLRAIDIAASLPEWREALNESSWQRVRAFVKSQAGSAVHLFKAIQCIRGFWPIRLMSMKSSRTLGFGDDDLKYGDVLSRPSFHALRKSLDSRRPERTLNNFADAFALALLAERSKDFHNSRALHCPVFYDHSGLFRTIVNGAGLSDAFTVRLDDGRKISALRDSDFFIFRSAFAPHSPGGGDKLKSSLPSYDELHLIYNHISDLLSVEGSATEALLKISLGGRFLGDILDDLNDLAFFGNVWLPGLAGGDIHIAIRDLDETVARIDSEEFREGIAEAIRTTKTALENNINSYRSISTTWLDIERELRAFSYSSYISPTHVIDARRDFFLYQFGFPEQVEIKLSSVLNALTGGDAEADAVARASLAQLLAKDNAEIEDAALVAALLWVLRLDEGALRFLNENRRGLHRSLRLVYAAALLRSREPSEESESLLALLEKEYHAVSQRESRFAVALAYLWYFTARRHNPLWRTSPFFDKSQWVSELDRAIYYSREALLVALKPSEESAAINSCLYCLVEKRDEQHRGEMSELADKLHSFEAVPELWHRNFSDTLACYFHLLSTWSPSATEARELLTRAIRYSELGGGIVNVEHEVHRNIIVLALARIKIGEEGA